MKVVYFQRKRSIFFSIENVFELVRAELPEIISQKICEMRYKSSGFVNRLLSGVHAMFNQGDVNHVTGDIHFICLFLKGKKTVLTIHDLGFLNKPPGVSRTVLKWFWVDLPVRHVNLITTVSETTKQQLLTYCPVAEGKVRVIYNPISKAFQPKPKKFNKENPVLLQVGTTPNKNISRLARALQGIKCELHVLGVLSEEDRQQVIENKLVFREFVNMTTNEVVILYEKCDVLVFASTIEGFGLPIVEANAVGRVVVTSNISSMPEVAGDSAHLVDPYSVESIRSGILKVIDDDSYRQDLIEKGYENCMRFNTKRIANQYSELYFNLAKKNKNLLS